MDEEIKIQGNIDINQALKEFEAKSQQEQVKKVATTTATATPDVPKMIQLVMKWSGFKEQKQAEYILLGFVFVAIAVSIYLFMGGGSPQPKINPAMLEQMQKSIPNSNKQ